MDHPPLVVVTGGCTILRHAILAPSLSDSFTIPDAVEKLRDCAVIGIVKLIEPGAIAAAADSVAQVSNSGH